MFLRGTTAFSKTYSKNVVSQQQEASGTNSFQRTHSSLGPSVCTGSVNTNISADSGTSAVSVSVCTDSVNINVGVDTAVSALSVSVSLQSVRLVSVCHCRQCGHCQCVTADSALSVGVSLSVIHCFHRNCTSLS